MLTDLHTAAAAGDLARVTSLLKFKKSDVTSSTGITPLMKAAEKGHETCVAALCDAGASVQLYDKGGWTALTYAASSGHVDVMSSLVRYGADVNHRSKIGWTPLMYAAKEGHMPAVTLLLKCHCDRMGNGATTALELARQAGHAGIVASLEAVGVEDAGDDAIMVTIGYSSSFIENPGTIAGDLGESLLKRRESRQKGAGIIRGRRRTAGSIASSVKNMGTLTTEESSNKSVLVWAGWPPLFTAALKGDTTSIKMLSNLPDFNVNQTAEFDWTALMWSVDACQSEATALLIQLGADVNALSRTRWSPLMYACMRGNQDAVSALIQAGANVNHSDKKGVTPLMLATTSGNIDIMKLLCTAHCNVNATNKWGQTALHGAVFFELLECVQFLLSAGASPRVRIQSGPLAGKTAVHIAKSSNASEALLAAIAKRHPTLLEETDRIDAIAAKERQLAQARKLSSRIKTTIHRWFSPSQSLSPSDRIPSQPPMVAPPQRPTSPIPSVKASSPTGVSEGYVLHDDDGPTTQYGSVKSSRRVLSPTRRQHQASVDDSPFPDSPGGRVFVKPRRTVDMTHRAYQEL